MGTVRWTYNRCVEAIEQKKITKINKKSLRAYCVNLNSDLLQKKVFKWVLETPYEMRDQAMEDCLLAYQTNFDLLRNNQRTHFKVIYRRRKFRSGGLKVIKKAWVKGVINPQKTQMGEIYSSEPLPLQLDSEASVLQIFGNWYITLTMKPKEREPSSTMNRQNKGYICSIDPGVRIFGVVYDPIREKVFKWGEKDASRVTRLCINMDKIQSKMNQKTTRTKQRYNLRKAFHRLQAKVTNLVNEFHKKFVKWLSDHYEYVLLPTFNAHDMCEKRKRKIRSKTVRNMLNWSHGRFRTRLSHKDGCVLIPVTEEYTSQGCSECGHLWQKIGGAKTYKCRHSDCVAGQKVSVMDRDCNGAKNIFQKWVIDNCVLSLQIFP